MKIDICNYNRQYYFAYLVPGAVFSDKSERDMTTDRVFIKIEESEDGDENAIRLENGERLHFNSFDVAFPLKATLELE